MLYRDPCVFAVEHEYQIAFNTTEFGIAWVEVGGREYRDSRKASRRNCHGQSIGQTDSIF